MSVFAREVTALTGVAEERIQRLAGGELSEVLLLRRPDGRCTVAKHGPAVAAEAAMLRRIGGVGVPVPMVEGEHGAILLLEYIQNDAVLSAKAWASIGAALKRLHSQTGETYGWSVDYRIGTVELNNRPSGNWPAFWGERRLLPTGSVLDRPWRERIHRLVPRLAGILPAAPAPALLHGDLWTGNILVAGGRLAALIDPACYNGDSEVDLAMLTLFASPPPEFWEAYGEPEQGWEERQAIYQLFPALVHLRLFGASYAFMVDRLLTQLGA